MGRLDPHLGEILFLQDNKVPAFVFESLHNLVRGDFLLIGVRDFFVADRAEVSGSELTETEFLFSRCRIDGYRNIDEAEADTALPDRAHSRRRLFTTPA